MMFTKQINKRKTGAILMGLTLSLTGSVLAAPATDLDSRIAALEQEQQKLADELATLKHQNSQLKNQVKSQKTQLKGLNKNLNTHKERIQLSGFGRLSWDNDNIKGYIDRNDCRRTYIDLKAKMKVNDKWNFNLESETNERYADYVVADGSRKYHDGHEGETDGTIQRVWAEGKIGVWHVDAGRRWRGLGFQNILLGNETDGVVLSTPVPQSRVSASAFYLTPTDKGYDFSVYGGGVQGQVGHGLQINCAFAKVNRGRNDIMGTNYYDKTTSFSATLNGGTVNFQLPSDNGVLTKINGGGTLNGQEFNGYAQFPSFEVYWGNGTATIVPTNYDDSTNTASTANGTIAMTENYKTMPNTAGSYGFVLSAMWNPFKNLFLIGDFARTDRESASYLEYGDGPVKTVKYGEHNSTAVRLNYRWSNIDNPGSFQLYARYFNYAANENGLVGIFGDKEWGAFQPGAHGWALGFKYVPLKNMEWETFVMRSSAHSTIYYHKDEGYHRNFVRTMVDYHF